MANVEAFNTNLTETQLNNAFDRALSDYTDAQIDVLLAAKQDVLTFDTAPTASSTNPVTSGGIYSALIGLKSIENGTDLDTLTAPGQYRTSSADATATLTHCPVSDQAIRLEVTYSSHVNRFIQRLYPANSDDGSFYVRKYLNGWGSWFRFAGQEVT